MDAPEPVENLPDLSSKSDVDIDERGAAVSNSHSLYFPSFHDLPYSPLLFWNFVVMFNNYSYTKNFRM